VTVRVEYVVWCNPMRRNHVLKKERWGKEMQLDCTHLVFAVQVMGLLDYNDDFPNNSGIVNINIGYGLLKLMRCLVMLECLTAADHWICSLLFIMVLRFRWDVMACLTSLYFAYARFCCPSMIGPRYVAVCCDWSEIGCCLLWLVWDFVKRFMNSVDL
jgi:hypothetical protein